MSWGELLSKGSSMRGQTRDGGDNEFVGRDQDQRILLSLADTERSNVNGRYPIGREFGGYRKFSKRYPVAKRSPRPTQLKTTDPKVVLLTLRDDTHEWEKTDQKKKGKIRKKERDATVPPRASKSVV